MIDFREVVWLLGSAFLALIYIVLKDAKTSARHIAALSVMALFISVFLVPAVAEYYELTTKMSSGLSGLLVLFGTKIIDALNKKIPEKIKEKIDNF